MPAKWTTASALSPEPSMAVMTPSPNLAWWTSSPTFRPMASAPLGAGRVGFSAASTTSSRWVRPPDPITGPDQSSSSARRRVVPQPSPP